jgi:hypothetical protein
MQRVLIPALLLLFSCLDNHAEDKTHAGSEHTRTAVTIEPSTVPPDGTFLKVLGTLPMIL